MAVDYVGKQALSFEKGKELEPVAQVILNLGTDDEGNALIAKYPTADPQSGRVVEYELPLITSSTVASNIAQNIFTKLSGFTYKPFSAESALLDPSYQIGDQVNVNGGVYALGSIRTCADHLYSADIAAPVSEEEDHEYTVNNNRTVGEIKKLIVRTEASIRTTINSITLTVESIEGDISTIEQTLGGITTRVGTAEGNISTLQQTATSLSSRISSAEGDISTLEQTSTSLRSRIISAEGDINSIEQTLQGVAFTSSLAAGTTIINGGCITTGTIEAERIGAGTLRIGDRNINGMLVLNQYCSLQSFRSGEMDIVGEDLYFDCNTFNVQATSWLNIDATGTIDIVSDATGGITLEANGATVRLTDTTGSYPCFYPNTDDKIKLGYPSRRWEAVYATDGVIQTSDMRKKKQRPEKMSDYDVFFKKLKPISFEWKDKKDKKRRNGFHAQEVEAALTECGLNADECGFIQIDVDENGDYTYGLNYSWLIPILVDKVQRIEVRLNGKN